VHQSLENGQRFASSGSKFGLNLFIMDVDTLPYDDAEGEKYAEEHPEHAFTFKNRIGTGRLYLLSESSAANKFRVRSGYYASEPTK
jgi:hypothetical protein